MVKSETQRNLFYQILTRKITILILLVAFTPLVLTLSILLYGFQKSYTEKIEAHISELVLKHSEKIDDFLAEKLGNIRFIAEELESTNLDFDTSIRASLNLLKKQYGEVFTDLGLVDAAGRQIAYQGPFNLKNANYAASNWYIQAKDHPYFISDVFAGLRGYPHFIIAVQITLKDQAYILRSTVNFKAFNALVRNIHVGQTGVAFVLNGDGELQTRRDSNFNLPDISAILQTNPASKDRPAFHREKSQTGTEYLYAASPLKNIDWTVVFRQDVKDAYKDITRTRMLALAIFAIGCIAIAFVAWTLPRKIVGLISSADQKSEAMNKQVVESGKLATIGELAAGIAHEINNPVAIMVEEAGWVEDLIEEGAMDPDKADAADDMKEIRRALTHINTQGLRCKEITHKLLSFARKTDTTATDVQINDLLLEIVGLTAKMAGYDNVQIHTRLEEDLPYVRLSPSELQQVILNLVNNGIDAMGGNGGTITISTALTRLDTDAMPPEAAVQSDSPWLEVSIEDNGCGIPKDNLTRIFDPFYTTKAVGKGTGLGLSICYGIIEKMGGKINVESQVGQGTRFNILLPLADSSQDPEPLEETESEHSQLENAQLKQDDTRSA